MSTAITMPQLGESVTEGTITRWLKREGETIQRDEPLLEVMTDKVNAEIPSAVAGVVSQILVPEGTKVAVGEVLVLIEEQGVGDREREAYAGTAVSIGSQDGARAVQEASGGIDDTAVAGGRYSPLVRRLAREHGIDLNLITGTGISGRVTKDDVLEYVNNLHVAARPEPARLPGTPIAPPLVEARSTTPEITAAGAGTVKGEEENIITPSPMRLAIAEHMVRSKQTAPHAWTLVEVDMTSLVRLREQLKGDFERREGVGLTYLPFVVKAVVTTLKEVPELNASWVDNKIVLKRAINIGIAVAVESGLIVPVVRDADRLSIAGLTKAIAGLVAKARDGKLSPADVQGGTFTVNNPGAFGSIVSVPIINQGQAAILAMEAIVKRAVVTADDAIAVRSMMNLGLSFDHRVVDGASTGRFLQAIKRRLEEYGPQTSIY